MEHEFVLNNYTNTIRLMPENYWVASIINESIVFDSWDGMTKDLFEKGIITKKEVINFFNNLK